MKGFFKIVLTIGGLSILWSALCLGSLKWIISFNNNKNYFRGLSWSTVVFNISLPSKILYHSLAYTRRRGLAKKEARKNFYIWLRELTSEF